MDPTLASFASGIAGALAAILGMWIGGCNWVVFWNSHVQRRHAQSWTPLLAGGLCAATLLLLPVGLERFWWVPFLLDWGSLPGITEAVVIHLLKRKDNEHTSS